MTKTGTVRVCPEGPLIVRGAKRVLDGQGGEHEVTRPVVALCGCGKSARQPWCDSTHKSIPDKPSTPGDRA